MNGLETNIFQINYFQLSYLSAALISLRSHMERPAILSAHRSLGPGGLITISLQLGQIS
jgi:hypothetical protein